MNSGSSLGYHWLGESSQWEGGQSIYNKEINNINGGLNAESSKITVIILTQMVAQVVKNPPAMQETCV